MIHAGAMVLLAPRRQLAFLAGDNLSGLQLMCLMFAGFKRVAPEHAVGMELEEPFLTALQIPTNGEGNS